MKRKVTEFDLAASPWTCEACDQPFAVDDVAWGRNIGHGIHGDWRCDPCYQAGRPVVEHGLASRTVTDSIIRYDRENQLGTFVIRYPQPS